eukprot:12880595-Prorocentrum_lima.AAC.1
MSVPLQCNVRHQHIPIEGGRAHTARMWIWGFASRVAAGVAAVVCGHHNETHNAYPMEDPPPHMRVPNVSKHWP